MRALHQTVHDRTRVRNRWALLPLEGYPTSRSAYQLARKHRIVTPVIDEVYAMLYENKDVRQAVRDLMTRDLKPED